MSRNENSKHASGREPSHGDADDDFAHDDALSESLLSLDSTLPPTPLKQLLAADGASVYVLSRSEALAETIQEAGGEQYPVHAIGDWSEIERLVEQGRCRIVLLDVDALPGEVEACLDRLLELGSKLVVLVAAQRDDAQPLIGLLSARRVHRLLIKPATVGVTRLLLESAVNRYLQIRDDDPFDVPVESLTRHRRGRGGRRWIGVVAAGVMLVAAGLGAATWLGPGGLAEWRTLGGWLPPRADESGLSGGPAVAAGGADAVTEAEAPAAAAGEPSSTPGSPQSTSANEEAPAAAGGEAFADASGGADDGSSDAAAVSEPSGEADAREPAAVSSADETATLDAEAASDAGPAPESPGAAASSDAAVGTGDAAGGGDTAANAAPPAAADASSAAASTETPGPTNAPDAPGAADSTNTPDPADAPDAGALIEATESVASAVAADSADSTTAAEAAPAGAPTEPTEPAEPSAYDRLIETARTRIDQGRLITPEGDSARSYLEQATAANRADPRLVELRERLAGAVAAEARVRLDSDDVATAEALVNYAFELGLDPETQTQLDLELEAARQRAARARRAEWLELARTRIDEERLTAPAEDNARYYLSRLETEQPGYDGLAAAWSALREALAERASGALEAGDWERAEAAIAELEEADAAPDRVADLRERLDYGRRQAELLSEPAPAAEMTLVESGSADYPEEARREDVEGWVQVEFVVDENGAPADARVVASEPEGYFEQAALESVRGSRYAPYEEGGRVYERLVRVRVRFSLR